MVRPKKRIHTSLDDTTYSYLIYLMEIHNFTYLNESIAYLVEKNKEFDTKIRKDILDAVIDKVLYIYFKNTDIKHG